jgi:hypothetical protein
MHKGQTVIEFAIAPFAMSDDGLEDQLNKAVSEAHTIDSVNPALSRIIDAGNVADGVISTTNNTVIPISATWDSLLDKIVLFTEIVDGISEVWFNCRQSPKSSQVHGLLHSRFIPMQKWHGLSCLLHTR